MSDILESVFSLVFPKEKDVQILEALTAQDLKERLPISVDRESNLISLFDYRDKEVRRVIHEIRYQKNKRLAFMCAELLAEQILDFMYEKKEFHPRAKFLLLPVPTSKKKLRQRGFNQTELIADYVNKMIPTLKYCKETLRKDVDKISQMKNTAGCFSVINHGHIRDKVVIILSDTIAESTLKSVQKEISKHKPLEVLGATIAN